MRYVNLFEAAKFQLHPNLNPEDYKISASLKNVDKWKAKILSGNSLRRDQDVGDWDSVGYVMISLSDNTMSYVQIHQIQINHQLNNY